MVIINLFKILLKKLSLIFLKLQIKVEKSLKNRRLEWTKEVRLMVRVWQVLLVKSQLEEECLMVIIKKALDYLTQLEMKEILILQFQGLLPYQNHKLECQAFLKKARRVLLSLILKIYLESLQVTK